MASLVAARVDRAKVFATAHFPDGGDLPVLLNRVVGNLFLRSLRRRSFLNVGVLGVRDIAHQIYVAPELILRVSSVLSRIALCHSDEEASKDGMLDALYTVN